MITSILQQIERALGDAHPNVGKFDESGRHIAMTHERVKFICDRIAVLRYENELIDIGVLQQAASALTEGTSSRRDQAIGDELYAIVEALTVSRE